MANLTARAWDVSWRIVLLARSSFDKANEKECNYQRMTFKYNYPEDDPVNLL